MLSRALGCRHILEKHAVLLWPGVSKRMSATGWWSGDPTVANLLQGPGASSRSKSEIQNQSDLSRGFRAVSSPPPPKKSHLSILSPEPRQRYLSQLQGPLRCIWERTLVVVLVFLNDLCAPSQERAKRFGKVCIMDAGTQPHIVREVSRGEGHTWHTVAAT